MFVSVRSTSSSTPSLGDCLKNGRTSSNSMQMFLDICNRRLNSSTLARYWCVIPKKDLPLELPRKEPFMISVRESRRYTSSMTISSSCSFGSRAFKLVFDPFLPLPQDIVSMSCLDFDSNAALASRSSFSNVRTRCSSVSV